MEEILERAAREIDNLTKKVPQGKHIVTGDIRKLSGGLYRQIEDKTIANVLSLSGELLEQHSWAFGVIAFDWAYRCRHCLKSSTPLPCGKKYSFLCVAEKICARLG